MNNTFTLTFGKKPINYIERMTDCDLIENSFLQEPASEQVYIITGIRGCGKTVLMTSIIKDLQEYDDWVIVNLNPEKDLIEDLASGLYQNAKLSKLFLKKEFNFSFSGISFSLHGETPILTADSLIRKMLDYIKDAKKKVLITIDEAVSNEHMKVFAQTFQSLIRFEYPVYLLMTGLFENISKLQDDKSLTFLYRAPKVYLKSLNKSIITKSYKKIFNIDEDEAADLAKLTCGYAYAYQLLGYLLTKQGKTKVDDEILDLYDIYLSEYVYDKLWSELSSIEKNILKSIGTNEIISVKELILKSNKNSSYISMYRERLIKKGIIYSPEYGKVQFTLPRFSEYIKNK